MQDAESQGCRTSLHGGVATGVQGTPLPSLGQTHESKIDTTQEKGGRRTVPLPSGETRYPKHEVK